MATRIVCFRLTREEYQQLRGLATELGSPLASIVRDALSEYLHEVTLTTVCLARPSSRPCNTPPLRRPYTGT